MRLQDVETAHEEVSNELKSTREELHNLRQSYEAKEKIELQNESLVQRLQDMSNEVAKNADLKDKLEANQSIMINNDEMVRKELTHEGECCVIFERAG